MQPGDVAIWDGPGITSSALILEECEDGEYIFAGEPEESGFQPPFNIQKGSLNEGSYAEEWDPEREERMFGFSYEQWEELKVELAMDAIDSFADIYF